MQQFPPQGPYQQQPYGGSQGAYYGAQQVPGDGQPYAGGPQAGPQPYGGPYSQPYGGPYSQPYGGPSGDGAAPERAER